jgi:hypothetical protein
VVDLFFKREAGELKRFQMIAAVKSPVLFRWDSLSSRSEVPME